MKGCIVTFRHAETVVLNKANGGGRVLHCRSLTRNATEHLYTSLYYLQFCFFLLK